MNLCCGVFGAAYGLHGHFQGDDLDPLLGIARPWYMHTYYSILQWKAIKILRGVKTRTYKKRLGEVGLFSLKNTRLRGDLIAVYSNLMGGYRENEVRVFLKE